MASVIHNEPYDLENRASFTVVSRDRLRFHVQIEHKWKEYADLEGWQAWIIDSRGRRYLPEQIDSRKPDLIVFMWDQEIRSVRRNAFGRQRDSFEADLDLTSAGAPVEGGPFHAVFIRAPIIEAAGPEVEVLARVGDRPVLARQGSAVVASFHPELTDDLRLHRLFLSPLEET